MASAIGQKAPVLGLGRQAAVAPGTGAGIGATAPDSEACAVVVLEVPPAQSVGCAPTPQSGPKLVAVPGAVPDAGQTRADTDTTARVRIADVPEFRRCGSEGIRLFRPLESGRQLPAHGRDRECRRR